MVKHFQSIMTAFTLNHRKYLCIKTIKNAVVESQDNSRDNEVYQLYFGGEQRF